MYTAGGQDSTEPAPFHTASTVTIRYPTPPGDCEHSERGPAAALPRALWALGGVHVAVSPAAVDENHEIEVRDGFRYTQNDRCIIRGHQHTQHTQH